jgi:hypothetical protein
MTLFNQPKHSRMGTKMKTDLSERQTQKKKVFNVFFFNSFHVGTSCNRFPVAQSITQSFIWRLSFDKITARSVAPVDSITTRLIFKIDANITEQECVKSSE